MPVNPAHLELLHAVDEADAEADERLTPEGKLIADWFIQLSNARLQGIGMSAAYPQPLQFTEIHAWAQITGNRLSPWVLRLFQQMDATFLKCAIERINAATQK